MQEIWKEIPMTNGKYFVSSQGNIKRKKEDGEFLLNFSTDSSGYKKVYLRFANSDKLSLVSVHRIVAKIFVPNPMDYRDINHIDGNKQNNNVENLEWCSRNQSMTNAFLNGLTPNKKGVDNLISIPVFEYDLEGNYIRSWGSITEAAKFHNTNTSNISYACTGKFKTTANRIWSYERIIVNPKDYQRAAHKVAVFQYTPGGDYVNNYDSLEDASKTTRICKPNIIKACKGARKTAGGFVWSYTKLEYDDPKFNRPRPNSKRVKQYDEDMNLVAEYSWLGEAAKFSGESKQNISYSALNGIITKKGYYWRY